MNAHFSATCDQLDMLRESRRLGTLTVSDSGFVFDPISGNSFTANSTGLISIRLFRGEGSMQDIIETIANEYSVPLDMVEHSINIYLTQLRRCLL